MIKSRQARVVHVREVSSAMFSHDGVGKFLVDNRSECIGIVWVMKGILGHRPRDLEVVLFNQLGADSQNS